MNSARVADAVFRRNYEKNANAPRDQADGLAATTAKNVADADENASSRRQDIASKAIDNMEQRGVVSHAEALKMKEKLDVEYENERMVRIMAMDKLEEAELQRQLANKMIAARNAGNAETKAESNYENALAAKSTNDANVERAQRMVATGEEAKKSLQSAGVTEESVQNLRDWWKNQGGDEHTSLSDMFHAAAKENLKNIGILSMIQPWAIAAKDLLPAGKLVHQFGSQGDVNLGYYESAQLDIKRGNLDLKKASGKQSVLDLAVGNDQSDLESARADMQKDHEAVNDLQDRVANAKAASIVKESGLLANLGLSEANQALSSDRAIGGEAVKGADARKLTDDASSIAGHSVDLQAAAKIIESGANNLGMFMDQVDRLAAVFSQFNPAEMQQINQKLQTLESFVARATANSNLH